MNELGDRLALLAISTIDAWPLETLTNTHAETDCSGTCPLHAPSKHALNTAPLVWRPSKRVFERQCEHGVGHPDPDSLAWLASMEGERAAATAGVHGCDGCCSSERTS